MMLTVVGSDGATLPDGTALLYAELETVSVRSNMNATPADKSMLFEFSIVLIKGN